MNDVVADAVAQRPWSIGNGIGNGIGIGIVHGAGTI
jgi:hypothetical protein